MGKNDINHKLATPLLLKAGGVGILAAVVAVVITRLILGIIFPLPTDFQPLSYGALIFFTVLFTVLGVAVLVVVNRFAKNTLKTYNIVAVVAFFVSLIPDFAGAANPTVMPMGGESSSYLILILFHVVAAIAYLAAVNFLVRRS
jgi:hypothetical protein